MYTITYNLRDEFEEASHFYKQLSAYGSEVYDVLDEQFYEILMGYFRFRRLEGLKTTYSLHEGYLEMLNLGVLWSVYSGDALATGENTTEILQKLVELRESSQLLKPFVDTVRGICLTAMMSPDLYDNLGIAPPSLANFSDLIGWLEATGEFKYEVVRLKAWEAYFKTIAEEKVTPMIELFIASALWFEGHSVKGLGQYTKQVDRYLNELRPKRYWKEDVIFCGRRRVEYHLNMLGAEWLNLAYKKDFDLKPYKITLLPTCMKLLEEEDCKAQNLGSWQQCSRCTESCQVSILTEEAETLQSRVYMVSHNASLEDFPEELNLEQVAILGVACTLNLIEGGWMLAERGIPAQCVLLDYCGCKKHWHSEGMPTGLNLEVWRQKISL